MGWVGFVLLQMHIGVDVYCEVINCGDKGGAIRVEPHDWIFLGKGDRGLYSCCFSLCGVLLLLRAWLTTQSSLTCTSRHISQNQSLLLESSPWFTKNKTGAQTATEDLCEETKEFWLEKDDCRMVINYPWCHRSTTNVIRTFHSFWFFVLLCLVCFALVSF